MTKGFPCHIVLYAGSGQELAAKRYVATGCSRKVTVAASMEGGEPDRTGTERDHEAALR
jgi:hypothetical protein